MYLFFSIISLMFLLFLNHWRRKQIAHKICNMCIEEKCNLLNELIYPFGYSYSLSQDILFSNTNIFQKKTGNNVFCTKRCFRSGTILNALPVYFNYAEKTWMIEFLKGQYGINTIGKISVCYADRILDKQEQKQALFHITDTESIIELAFSFYKGKKEDTRLSSKHWCLSALKVGFFSIPSDLSMKISLTFPSYEMAKTFAEELVNTGYNCDDISIYRQTVQFTFGESVLIRNPFHKFRNRTVQSFNYFGCQVFSFVTRPFYLSVDRLLYLHYYLPVMLTFLLC